MFNVTANHSCDTGFDLVGNSSRTCSGDGSSITGAFDGEAPRCEGECIQIIIRTLQNTLKALIECLLFFLHAHAAVVTSSLSLIRDVVIPVVSVVAVLALVVLGGVIYGYINVVALILKNPQPGTAKLLST